MLLAAGPHSRPHLHLSWFQTVVLGLLQGVSELFPVSSLGHIVLLPSLFGWHQVVAAQSDPESSWLAFVVMLHVGSALGLLLYFWRDWVAHHPCVAAHTLVTRRVETPERAPGLVDHRGHASFRPGSSGWRLQHPLRVDAGLVLEAAAVFLMVNGGILLGAEERLRQRSEVCRPLAARDGPSEDEQSDVLETLELPARPGSWAWPSPPPSSPASAGKA